MLSPLAEDQFSRKFAMGVRENELRPRGLGLPDGLLRGPGRHVRNSKSQVKGSQKGVVFSS